MRRRWLTLALVVLAPALAGAQGLGDVAAREKQKRQATAAKPKARVITNDDLRKDEGKPAGSEASSTSAPAPAASESRSPDDRGHADPEAGAEPDNSAVEQARAAAEQARGAVGEAEARVKELGDKLNPMSPSFIYASPMNADAAGEEMRTREALQQAQAQLEQAREALARANQEYERVSRGQPARPLADR